MKPLLLLVLLFAPLRAATVTGSDGVSVEVNDPRRIVAINASTVEILIELGLGDRIVATDNGGERVLAPAKVTGLGHPYKPSVEGIIAQKPDLVIAPLENLKAPPLAQLRSAKVPVLVLESTSEDGIEGLKRRIAIIASVFSKETQAQALTVKIDSRLATIEKNLSNLGKRRRALFLYAHGPGSALIYGRKTGAHSLIELAGATNAADFTEGSKPITPEALVTSAPDDFILLDRGFKAIGGLPGVLALPGVPLTPAGKNKAIHVVGDNIRWIGPRFLDDVEKLHRSLYPAP